MLGQKHIVIFGGDTRQVHMIEKFLEQNVRVSLLLFDELNRFHSFKKTVQEVDWDTVDAIILPIQGTKHDGFVESTYSNRNEAFTQEQLSKTKRECLIFTGISNSYIDDITRFEDRQLIRLMDDDAIAIANSIPTAEGTIMMAIEEMDQTIHRANVMIIGFGRVGVSVARAFQGLGANVSVVARRREHYARIDEMGLTPLSYAQLKEQMIGTDLCINTVEKLVINEDILQAINKDAVIIDLASGRGGIDYDYAKANGIKAIKAPGLPGLVAPKTAGEILGKAVIEMMSEVKEDVIKR